VTREGVNEKLPPLLSCNAIAGHAGKVAAGGGLHDSSAALIPYLTFFSDPFVLLSTGTWCISLNPFNHTLLSEHELQQDCLCYLSFEGNPVKASRLFAGYEHEQQVKRLASYYQTDIDRYKKVNVDLGMLKKIRVRSNSTHSADPGSMIAQSIFASRDLSGFNNYDEAYHQLIADLMEQQVRSTNLIIKGSPVARIFVDGGFGNNAVFMHMLADAFPGIGVYAASMAQASALGAALVLHPHWNSKDLPSDLIELKLYAATQKTST